MYEFLEEGGGDNLFHENIGRHCVGDKPLDTPIRSLKFFYSEKTNDVFVPPNPKLLLIARQGFALKLAEESLDIFWDSVMKFTLNSLDSGVFRFKVGVNVF